MLDEASAEIFYGYIVSTSEEDESKIKDLADKADITAQLINEKSDSDEMIVGREIESADIPSTEKVKPGQLMENIKDIERTPELDKLEEKFSLKTIKPTLILTGRILNG